MSELRKKDLDFYQALRIRIKDWAATDDGQRNPWLEYLLVAPDLFHLLCKVMMDSRVPASEKVKIGMALAYFVAPIDVVPEIVVGPAGYIDDVVLAAWALNRLVNNPDPQMAQVVQEHWAGEGEVLETLRNIVEIAEQALGNLWPKVRARVDGEEGKG